MRTRTGRRRNGGYNVVMGGLEKACIGGGFLGFCVNNFQRFWGCLGLPIRAVYRMVPPSMGLEHFHQSCTDEAGRTTSGLFGFWLRFGSVTGFFKPVPSPKPRQKSKPRAFHRYFFAVNALGTSQEGTGTPFAHLQAGPTTRFSMGVPGNPGGKSRVVLSAFSATAQETSGWREC